MFVVTVLGWQRQEDHEFKSRLSYIVKLKQKTTKASRQSLVLSNAVGLAGKEN